MVADPEAEQGEVESEYWVSPLEKMIGLVDEKNELAQVYEYHARGTCRGASAWVAYHYPRTSSIVKAAKTDGARNIFTLNLGKGDLSLKPSLSPAGIESAELIGDELKLVYVGLAGAGVGIAKCRARAKNIRRVDIQAPGGGSSLGRAEFVLPVMYKIHIGIDDTDTAETGATWSLANEIGWHAIKPGVVEYLNHTIVQLYPEAPGKTKNCVATVLTFGIRPGAKDTLVDLIRNTLLEHTVSDNTGMAVFEGIMIPASLQEYTKKCRNEVVAVEYAETTASEAGAELIDLTGPAGKIGALAAIGYTEMHDDAVKLPDGFANRS